MTAQARISMAAMSTTILGVTGYAIVSRQNPAPPSSLVTGSLLWPWLLMVAGFLLACWGLAVTTAGRTLSRAAWLIASASLVSLPWLAGIPAYGRGDALVHVATVVDLGATGHLPPNVVYPHFVTFLRQVADVTGLAPGGTAIALVTIARFVFLAICLSTVEGISRRVPYAVLLTIALPVFSYAGLMYYPLTMGGILLALLAWSLLRIVRTRAEILIGTLIGTTSIFVHPLVAAATIATCLFAVRASLFRVRQQSVLILTTATVVAFVWLFGFVVIQQGIRAVFLASAQAVNPVIVEATLAVPLRYRIQFGLFNYVPPTAILLLGGWCAAAALRRLRQPFVAFGLGTIAMVLLGGLIIALGLPIGEVPRLLFVPVMLSLPIIAFRFSTQPGKWSTSFVSVVAIITLAGLYPSPVPLKLNDGVYDADVAFARHFSTTFSPADRIYTLHTNPYELVQFVGGNRFAFGLLSNTRIAPPDEHFARFRSGTSYLLESERDHVYYESLVAFATNFEPQDFRRLDGFEIDALYDSGVIQVRRMEQP